MHGDVHLALQSAMIESDLGFVPPPLALSPGDNRIDIQRKTLESFRGRRVIKWNEFVLLGKNDFKVLVNPLQAPYLMVGYHLPDLN
jgi:hypothetical protein